jgi:hypothetical protein
VKASRDRSADIAAAIFEGNSDAIYRAMRKRLLKGDVRVFAVLADGAFGKVKHSRRTKMGCFGFSRGSRSRASNVI